MTQAMRYNISGQIDVGELTDTSLAHNNLILSDAWLGYSGLITDLGYGYHRGVGSIACRVVQSPWPTDNPMPGVVSARRTNTGAVICQDEYGTLWVRSCNPEGEYDFVPADNGACWELHGASLDNR